MVSSIEYTDGTDGSWLPLAAVLGHLGVTAGSAQEIDADRARLAAAAYVERVRQDLFTVVETSTGTTVTYDVTADVLYGAVLLTARLYARRGTPQGIASFGELGAGAIMRLDPDIERLLGLGRHSRPVIG